MRAEHFVTFLTGILHDLVVEIQLDGRESTEEQWDDVVVDGVTGDVLTHGNLVLLSKVVAKVLGPALILDDHLVSALAA